MSKTTHKVHIEWPMMRAEFNKSVPRCNATASGAEVTTYATLVTCAKCLQHIKKGNV